MKSSQKGSTGKVKQLSHSNSLTHVEPFKKSAKGGTGKKIIAEKQGPIDWSTNGLKIKYRGETEREDIWKLWISAQQYASKSLNELDFIIPTVKVERHPLFVSYYKHLNNENLDSSTRTKNRLMMKRFVFDVQEVWLTNLEHLREHDPQHMYTGVPEGTSGAAAGAAALPDRVEIQDRRKGEIGLHNRRDSRAIESMDSQIQSVSQKRAFANAYHTARLPEIRVVLDYDAKPLGELQNIKSVPPTIEPLIRNVRLQATGDSAGGAGGVCDFAVVVPALHSEALFPNLVHVLHIDRLLPSRDYLQHGVMNVHETVRSILNGGDKFLKHADHKHAADRNVREESNNVLWRFTLFRNDDATDVQVCVCPESSVVQYTTSVILAKTQEQQNGLTSSYMVGSGMVYQGDRPIHLPCKLAPATATSGGAGGGGVIEVDKTVSGGAVSSTEAIVAFNVAALCISRRRVNGEPLPYFDCVEDFDRLHEYLGDIHLIKFELCVDVLGTTTNGVHNERKKGNSTSFATPAGAGAAATTVPPPRVYLECSPAELGWLLDSVAQAEYHSAGDLGNDGRTLSTVLGGPEAILWWLHPDRAVDVWPHLAQYLVLEADYSAAAGAVAVAGEEDVHVQYTLSFAPPTSAASAAATSKPQSAPYYDGDKASKEAGAVRREKEESAAIHPFHRRHRTRAESYAIGKVVPEQVPGALSSLEAMSCAYELLDMLRLVPQPVSPSRAATATGRGARNASGFKESAQGKIQYKIHLEGTSSKFFSYEGTRLESIELSESAAAEEAKARAEAGGAGTEGEGEGERGPEPTAAGGEILYLNSRSGSRSRGNSIHTPAVSSGGGGGGGGTGGLSPTRGGARSSNNAHGVAAPHNNNIAASSSSSSRPTTPKQQQQQQQLLRLDRPSSSSAAGATSASSSTSKPQTPTASSPHHHKQQHLKQEHPVSSVRTLIVPVTAEICMQVRTGLWEELEDRGYNLSMICSGALPTILQVPGACEFGRKGIWFPDQNTGGRQLEYTQAASRYFRDKRDTSSKSILVNMTFALDTSLLFQPLYAWEDFSSFPAPTPAEEVDGTIPSLSVVPKKLQTEALDSPIETRLSEPVMIFTSLPVEGVDFMPLDAPMMPKGFRRSVPVKNRFGFREQVEVTLLGVDPVLATMVFGITRTGAVPNNVGVNNRNLWHNTLAITEHINR
jgi:hypothetical protein